ncbi:sacsin-like [Mya arenaria]|uniref:sacsin-like n=1 Tax=Mya arenaria TaxID=6604 RepID=UPI0022E699D4|nr:sacsin-like [Mya arenaria]
MGDSDSGSDAEYAGIEQPPIIDQLRRILDEYRNDVQIIKELVQNADDAGASELRVLYQGETFNHEPPTRGDRFRKFFKAPALVFYNDAEFTEDDWRGIRQIYASIKADDPMKIGKYGLGFKSVFHLTDHPCIVSGQKILFIDPHERNPGKVCVTMKLNKLRTWRRLDINICLRALDGLFGFDSDTLDSGRFPGTLFWFGLRTEPNKLSESICDENQVERLMQAFVDESKRSLLFLKTICRVKMFANTSKEKSQHVAPDSSRILNQMYKGIGTPFCQVNIDNEKGNLRHQRKEMLAEVSEIGRSIPAESKMWTETVTVQTEIFGNCTVSKWFMISFMKGGDVSERFRTLLADEDICNPHLVGLASPIVEKGEYNRNKGHVFVYQPLPQESSAVTGLPVHVNAFFVLSQNRRHIRWPDTDNEVVDKKIEWNLKLVSEILPHAYASLIKENVRYCKNNGCKAHLVKGICNSIPDTNLVNERWLKLCTETLRLLWKQPILRTLNLSWIEPKSAVYLCMNKVPNVPQRVWEHVVSVFMADNPALTDVSYHVADSFEGTHPGKLSYLTPALLRNILLAYETYKSRDNEVKLSLLHFLSVDNDFTRFESLELLPLADSTFTKFEKTASSVYVEDQDTTKLFSDQSEKFLDVQAFEHHNTLFKDLEKTGLFQLKHLDTTDVVKLISEALNLFDVHGVETVQNSEVECWIKDLWTKIILPRWGSNLCAFENLPIFLACQRDATLRLVSLKDLIMIAPDIEDKRKEECIDQSFCLFGVIVIYKLPDWCNDARIRSYVLPNTSHGIMSAMESVSVERTQKFNEDSTDCQKDCLREFLSEVFENKTISIDCQSMLKRLNIFIKSDQKKPEHTLAQFSSDVYFIDSFPVEFPMPVLLANSKAELCLLKALRKKAKTTKDMIVLALQQKEHYSTDALQKLMFWLLNNSLYIEDDTILMLSKQTAFLTTDENMTCKACELFDPSDEVLKNIFLAESVFPVFEENFNSCTLSNLFRIGLKRATDIRKENILTSIERVECLALENFEMARRKSKSLMTFLNEHIDLVPVKESKYKHWIVVDFNDESYPQNMPLKSRVSTNLVSPDSIVSSKWVYTVGSVTNVYNCKDLPELANVYNWNNTPKCTKVIDHLSNVISVFQPQNKTECLKMITDIYKHLSELSMENDDVFDEMKQNWDQTFNNGLAACVWNGSDFSPISNIYIESQEGDVNLHHYMRLLPSEMMDVSEFCLRLGCQPRLGLETYLKVLAEIDTDSVNGTLRGQSETLKIAIDILNTINEKYFEETDDDSVRERLLFPIDTPDQIVLQPVSKCALDDLGSNFDDNPFNDDEDIYFINPKVPDLTAKALGVRSAMQQLLSSSDAFEEWGQEEPLTRRIHMLLQEGYIEGLAIAKELLQNADDAGASKLFILYDQRTNDDLKSKLLSPELKQFQGPALWAFNDAVFSEKDFKNITKLGGATKETDASKIGKFGLGFCSVYNVTDVPSFVSRDSFVMFDPHMTHLSKALPGKNPEIRINFQNERNKRTLQRLKHQFQVFDDIFGCNLTGASNPFFNGTLFRLPLRVRGSEISDKIYFKENITELLGIVIQMAPNMFLFNQNVNELKIFHLNQSETPGEMKLVYELQKDQACLIPKSLGNIGFVQETIRRKQNNDLKSNPLRAMQKISVSYQSHKNIPIGTRNHTADKEWFVS